MGVARHLRLLTLAGLVLAACESRGEDPVSDWDRLRKVVAPTGAIESAAFTKGTGWRTAHGFRWQLVVADGEGRFLPAKPAEQYKTGDRFRVRVQSLGDLHVSVLAVQSKGELVRLWPRTGAVKLTAGEPTDLPNETQWFDFRGDAGDCQLRLVATPQPLPEADDKSLVRTLTRYRDGESLQPGERALAERVVAPGAREVFPRGQSSRTTERESLAAAARLPAPRDAELVLIDSRAAWYLTAYLSPAREANPVLIHDLRLKHAK